MAETKCAGRQKVWWTLYGRKMEVATRMVGCGRLIRMAVTTRAGSGTHIRLHLVEKMLEQNKLDRQGLVLFACGNYAEACGPEAALKVAQHILH